MKSILSPLLALCLATTASAADRPEKPTMRLDFAPLGVSASSFTWPSGLQMVVGSDELSDAVAVTLVVDGGWASDPAGKAGLTALLERAWWRSEVSPGVTVLDQLVNGYGCTVDSFVEPDLLRVTGTCPATSIDAAMKVWGRLLGDPLAGVTEATLAQERGRVRTEATVRAALSTAQVRAWVPELMHELFPDGHAYRRDQLADLDAVTLEDLRAYASASVTPAATTVVVMGGYDDGALEYALSLVSAHFPLRALHPDLKPEMQRRFAKEEVAEPDEEDPSHWFVAWGDPADPKKSMAFAKEPEPRAKRFSGDPPAPPPVAPFRVVRGGSDDPVILVGWSLPPAWKGQDGTYRVLAKLVHAMIGQYLEEPSLDRIPGCFVVPGLQASVLTCAGVLKKGQEASAERVSRRMVDQLTYITDMGNRTGVDIAVGSGQVAILSNLMWDFDPLGGLWDSRGYWVSTGVHLVGDPNALADLIASVPDAQPEALIDLTTKWITRDRSRTVAILPAEKPQEVALRLKQRDPADRDVTAEAPTYWDRLATGVAPLPRPANLVADARLASTWSAVPNARLHYTKLGNGLPVLAISQPELPVAHARLVSFNGRALDPSDFQAYHYAREFMRASRDAMAAVETFGGSRYAWRDDLLQHFGIRHSPVNADQALWVLRELMETWRVTFASKSVWLKAEVDAIVANWYDPAWHATDLANAHLFPGSPLANDISWEAMQRWSELGADDVQDIMLTKWRPENMTLLYVGPGPAKDMSGKAGKHFSSWTPAAPASDAWQPRTPPTAALPTGRAVTLMPGEGAMTDVRLTCRLDADPVVRQAAEHLVRRHTGRGWSSIHTQTTAWPGGTSVLELQLRAENGAVGPALVHLLGQLDALAAGIDDVEARTAAWRGAMDTAPSLSSYSLTVARYARLIGEGQDWKAEADRGAAVAALNGAALTPVIARCAGSAFVAVIGDADAVGKALDGAGVASERVDWLKRGKDLHRAADPKGFARMEKKKAP
jgi:predicted Zn-dependent peptidase